jgi:hypothetical protein
MTRRVLFLSLGIAALLTASPVTAQAPRRPFAEGTHYLRAIIRKTIEDKGPLQPFRSVGEFYQAPLDDTEKILVVVLGKTDFIANFPGRARGLQRFLEGGGALLVATDRQTRDGGFDLFNLRVDGTFVQTSGRLASGYRELPDCPFVEPIDATKVPVFRGLKAVATNRPSCLFESNPQRHYHLPYLARFPKDCATAGVPNEFEEFDRPARHQPLWFAAGGEVGAGRALLLADHSVFINEMMMPTDNDNFDMAVNAIDWLTDGGKRNRVLFLEEGEVVSNFNVALKEPPLPPLPSEPELIQVINRALVGLEEENYFNKELLKRLAPSGAVGGEYNWMGLGHARLLNGLILFLSLGLLAFGWLRLSRARHRLDASLAPALPVSGASVHERHQALVWADNLWEPARALSRQFFDKALAPRSEDWSAATASQPPRVLLGDAARERLVRRQVRELWRLATGRPMRVAAADYVRLAERVRDLQAALADGTLRLHAEQHA